MFNCFYKKIHKNIWLIQKKVVPLYRQKMERKTNIEINNHYKFDFCFIEGDNTVVCYNGDENLYQYAHVRGSEHAVPNKEKLLNVEIWIDGLGILHIEGKAYTSLFYKVNGQLHQVPKDRRNFLANYIMSNYALVII